MRGFRLSLFATLLLNLSTALASNGIDIEITSHLGDAQSFVEGDVISFYISLDKDAYVYVFMHDAGGTITQLVPNQYSDNNFFEAGLFIPIPNQASPFKFTISAPFGKETLWAFASSEPLNEHPRVKNIALNNLQAKYRRLALENDYNFGDDSLTISTQKRLD